MDSWVHNKWRWYCGELTDMLKLESEGEVLLSKHTGDENQNETFQSADDFQRCVVDWLDIS